MPTKLYLFDRISGQSPYITVFTIFSITKKNRTQLAAGLSLVPFPACNKLCHIIDYLIRGKFL
jgi:hypothetical protein